MSRDGVTLNGVLDWRLDLLSTLHTQHVITPNHSAIADLHTLQINVTHAKSFPACSVFTSSCLVTASNNGSSYPNGGSLPTEHSCN
jgi:hypothetical protein